MATKAEILKAREKWKQHCETVQAATVANINETAEQRLARLRRLLLNYSDFVDYYFPTGPKTPKQGSPPLRPVPHRRRQQNQKNRNLKAGFVWHRGAAKSTNMDVFIPMWLMAWDILGAEIFGAAKVKGREINVMVLVGKSGG